MIAETTLLLALLASAPQGEVAGQTPAPAGTRSAAPAQPQESDAQLLEEGRRTAQRVERIRGLRLAAIPPAVRADDAGRKDAAVRRVAAVLPASALDARGRAWADLGLGAAESPRRFLGALADDLQGIAFDPGGRTVQVDASRLTTDDFAPKEGEDPTASVLLATGVRPDEPALAHAIVHALQRGRTGADPMAGTTDAALAASAWAEGEANLVAVLFLFEGLGIQGQVLEKALDPGQLLGGSLLPASLDLLPGVEGLFLDFVYREGYAQVAAAYRSGGWRGVDRSVAARRSTRDVLHPDRPPLSPASIPDPGAPKGLALADRDSLGEEGIVVLVSLLTGKDNLGLMAGDGWAGDALLRYEPAGSPTGAEGLTVWITRWVSPEEAVDFEYGLERCLTARFPGAAFVPPIGTERRMVAAGKSLRLSRSGPQVVLRVSSESADRPDVKAPPRRPPGARKSSKSK